MSHATVLKHIRKAESKLFADTLDDTTGGNNRPKRIESKEPST